MPETLFDTPTPKQERIATIVRRGLTGLGYADDLILRDYKFQDYFDPDLVVRRAPMVAFGHRPTSYDSACLAVAFSNGIAGTDLVSLYRALGAHVALEITDDAVNVWRVSTHPSSRDLRETIGVDRLAKVITGHQEWAPSALMRAKNISALEVADPQQDFVDRGLIPALEQQIQRKINPLLRDTLQAATKLTDRRSSDWQETMFRVVFWLLAGKVLHDRGIDGFTEFDTSSAALTVLRRVAQYYNTIVPSQLRQSALDETFHQLWSGLDFRNLSVEVLAYVYENTLVNEELRQENSIHATPPAVARYIVRHLPFERFAPEDRHVIEPCCGHSTFLVAALQRMRMLLPADWDPPRRHRYFAHRLRGFDIDTFALEVSRLSLTLADFPNRNGWRLDEKNVFASRTFNEAVSEARIALCNPPFRDFAESERRQFAERSIHKPAELLLRVLDRLDDTAVLGFVMPMQVLDGRGYKAVRDALVKRFSELHLVSLPDNAFATAQQETVLVLGTKPRDTTVSSVVISHGKVSDSYCKTFVESGTPQRVDVDERPAEAGAKSLAVPALGEVWRRTASFPTLSTIARIHRGIEWHVGLLTERPEALVSDKPIDASFVPGVHGLGLCAFELPPQQVFLSLNPAVLRGHASEQPWAEPKVIMNASRTSRGPWRLAACGDVKGLVPYQTYLGLWPTNGWSPDVLAAFLNGPIVNAFVSTREGNRNVTIEVLGQAPVPTIDRALHDRIAALVTHYVAMVRRCRRSTTQDFEPARVTLRAIDAEVLRAYALSPRLERELLDYMNGPRAVPFEFGSFYPADFPAYIPLWRFDGERFAQSTAARFLDQLPASDDENFVASLEHD